MAKRTTKMTESHGVMGVRGQSAQSGPRWLDQGAAWTGGGGGHRVNKGRAGVGWLELWIQVIDQ
jgi:hypothetical protein